MSLPDMMEWAKEHPDRAAVRIAELERENAALREELNCQKVCASDLAEKVRELRQESAMYEKMWKEANRLFITWCPESVKARKETQP